MVGSYPIFAQKKITPNIYDWKFYWGIKNYDNLFSDAASKAPNFMQGSEIGLIKRFSPILDLQFPITFGTVAHYDDSKNTGYNTGTFGFHGLVNLHPNLNWFAVPYVYSGLGVHQVKGSLDVGVPVGVGLVFRVSDRFALMTSTGYRKSFTADRSSWLNTLGLTLNLGDAIEKNIKKPKKVKPIPVAVDTVVKVTPEVIVQKVILDTVKTPEPVVVKIEKVEEKVVKPEPEVIKPKVVIEPKHEEVQKVLTFTLQDVQFKTGSYALQPHSMAVLESIYRILVDNSDLKIAINGHTDKVGNEASNIKLSTARAKACYDFLVSKGISSSRFTYKGYGSSQPKDTNDTDEGRRANRRVEFIRF